MTSEQKQLCPPQSKAEMLLIKTVFKFLVRLYTIILLILNICLVMARRHGLVVKADCSCLRGRGFKPRHRILDGCKLFVSYVKKVKIKVAKWGTPKKIFKKTSAH